MVVKYESPRVSASRRIVYESLISFFPAVVLITRAISLAIMRSTMCGLPSRTLLIRCAGMPLRAR